MSMTISPFEVEQAPLPAGDLGLPGWARTALEYINAAGRAGETVSLVPDEVTLSPAQMAAQVGVSRASIQRRITAGQIRCKKVGARYRIPQAEVDRFRRQFVREMATTLADDF
jgi:excisionase family DNA binding protein